MYCRHAFGDQYQATDINVRGPGTLELVFTPDPTDNSTVDAQRYTVCRIPAGDAVALGMYNTDESISHFAKACFTYALEAGNQNFFCSKSIVLLLLRTRQKLSVVENSVFFA